jgi:uncharacterized protein YbbC (DUF1343 family)
MVGTGLQRVVDGDSDVLRGKRIGLIANPTSVDGRLRHAVDLLHQADGVELVSLFGPEHGLRSDVQDMVATETETDRRTGLPVYSLYGHEPDSLSPTLEQLDGLDAMVFDIQDVGSRYYTYVWTMVLSMRVCARAGVEMIVLDRPNPINGVDVEGGDIADGFDSFVGVCSVPNRHGMTAGEIARMMRAREGLDVELTVVELDGWSRDMFYDQTELPWVMPSPNMPTLDTALVYPGMCLVEGTELSEGRGTTRPFEIAGAPWVDGYALAEALAKDDLPGVLFRPLGFFPMFQKHGGTSCGGVQIHVTDRRAFRPYLTGVAFIRAARGLDPDAFAWRTRAYEFVDDIPAIDLLAGSEALRAGIDNGASMAELAATWADAEQAFHQQRAEHLLYR